MSETVRYFLKVIVANRVVVVYPAHFDSLKSARFRRDSINRRRPKKDGHFCIIEETITREVVE